MIMSCERLTQKMQERSDSNPNLCMRTVRQNHEPRSLTHIDCGRQKIIEALSIGSWWIEDEKDDATDLKGIVAAGHLNATAM